MNTKTINLINVFQKITYLRREIREYQYLLTFCHERNIVFFNKNMENIQRVLDSINEYQKSLLRDAYDN